MRQSLSKDYPYLFPQKQKKGKGKRNKIEIPRWDKWIWKLSDGNSDEDTNKISESLVRNFLYKINQLIEESQKKKKK
jgi:hypothetical protein